MLLEPDDHIARLVAAVPPPRWHLLRYFGVLSSHSSRRRLLVPRWAERRDEPQRHHARALGARARPPRAARAAHGRCSAAAASARTAAIAVRCGEQVRRPSDLPSGEGAPTPSVRSHPVLDPSPLPPHGPVPENWTGFGSSILLRAAAAAAPPLKCSPLGNGCRLRQPASGAWTEGCHNSIRTGRGRLAGWCGAGTEARSGAAGSCGESGCGKATGTGARFGALSRPPIGLRAEHAVAQPDAARAVLAIAVRRAGVAARSGSGGVERGLVGLAVRVVVGTVWPFPAVNPTAHLAVVHEVAALAGGRAHDDARAQVLEARALRVVLGWAQAAGVAAVRWEVVGGGARAGGAARARCPDAAASAGRARRVAAAGAPGPPAARVLAVSARGGVRARRRRVALAARDRDERGGEGERGCAWEAQLGHDCSEVHAMPKVVCDRPLQFARYRRTVKNMTDGV
ncbi:MAG: transposase [Polyangiaceae bacterium]|nr:transposase [Polyangiaceae bacterium]